MVIFAAAQYEATDALLGVVDAIERDLHSLVNTHKGTNAQFSVDADARIIEMTFQAPDLETSARVWRIMNDRMQRFMCTTASARL